MSSSRERVLKAVAEAKEQAEYESASIELYKLALTILLRDGKKVNELSASSRADHNPLWVTTWEKVHPDHDVQVQVWAVEKDDAKMEHFYKYRPESVVVQARVGEQGEPTSLYQFLSEKQAANVNEAGVKDRLPTNEVLEGVAVLKLVDYNVVIRKASERGRLGQVGVASGHREVSQGFDHPNN